MCTTGLSTCIRIIGSGLVSDGDAEDVIQAVKKVLETFTILR